MSKYIEVPRIIPGDFYASVQPGHFTCALTRISIPGPRVKMNNEVERIIIGIDSLPDPVQLPHFKRVTEATDKDGKRIETVEVNFDRQDSTPLHEAFAMALGTGIIRHVPDEEVAKRYPTAWASRRDRYVFDLAAANRDDRPMRDLLAEHEKVMDAKAAISAIGKGKSQPPPPVKA